MCCSERISLVAIHPLIIANSKILYRLHLFSSGCVYRAVTVVPFTGCITLTTLHPTIDATKYINFAVSVVVGVEGVTHLSYLNV